MRVLLCSLDTPGYLQPALGIAHALRARGHMPAFVANQTCASDIAAAGFERIARSADRDGVSFQVKFWGTPLSVAIQVKHTEYAIARFKPDVLLAQQLTLGPLLAAERTGVPLAILGLCTYLWSLTDPAPAPGVRMIERLKGWRYRDTIALCNQARTLIGMRQLTADDGPEQLLGQLFMVRSVEALEGELSQLPDVVHLVGGCLWEPPATDPDLQRWLDCETEAQWPLIYVQHGRFFDSPSFWRALVDALGSLPVRVAASVGRMDVEVGQTPPNFFVRPYVAQSAVLPRAAAMIASPNTTAVLGAVTTGISSLLVPSGGEQPDVADCCQRAGVARVVPAEEATADRILSELRLLLLDSAMKQTAGRIADAFAATDSFAVVCGLLEQVARQRGPVRRSAMQAVVPQLGVPA